ncbi:MAG TPA: MFS transporter [Gaiellaceae bacterium]|nr:MFS transporter [Gaiellaceae bacterium]
MTTAPDPGGASGALSSLRANRNFRLLWIGQILSDLGTQIGTIAYPLLVLALTHSALIAGVVATAAEAAAFAVRLPAGALADRLDRRRAMMLVDGARTIALAVLAVLVATGAVSWPVVLVVAVIDRVGDTLFTPSSIAALPLIVPDEHLEAGWAVSEGRQYAANLVGPPLGGLLYGLGRAVPFLADAVSYGISVLTSRAITGDFATKQEHTERRGLWAESLQGLKLLWHDAFLRAVLIQAPLINFAFSGAIFTLILGLRRNGVSAVVIGTAEAVVMVGGIVGAILAPRIRARLTVRQALLLLTGSGTILFLAAAVVMPSPAVAIPLALPLVLSPATNAALFGTVLRRAPASMHGRVNAGLFQVATALAAVAPLIGGLVVNEASAGWAMVLFAAALALSVLVALVFPLPLEETDPNRG